MVSVVREVMRSPRRVLPLPSMIQPRCEDSEAVMKASTAVRNCSLDASTQLGYQKTRSRER